MSHPNSKCASHIYTHRCPLAAPIRRGRATQQQQPNIHAFININRSIDPPATAPGQQQGMGAAAVERGSPQAQPPHLSIPVYEPGGTAAAVVAAANGDGRRNSSSGSSSNQHHAHAHTQDGPTDQASKAPSPPASAAGPAEEQEQQPPPSSSAARRRASKPHQQSPPQQQQQRPRRQCAGSGRLCPSPAALRRARRPLLLALGVTALLLVGSFLAARYKKNLLSAAEWIRGQAPWSAVYYSVIIFVWIFLCLPSSLVEMVAGMIYSYPTALATVVVGKQLACNLSFVLGRRFLSTSVLMRGEGLLLARLGEEGKEEEAEAEAAVAAAAVAAAEGTASHSSSEEEDGEGGSEGLSRGSSPLRSVEGGGGGDGGVEMVEVIGGEGAVGVEEEQPPPRPPRPPHSNATMQVGVGLGWWWLGGSEEDCAGFFFLHP